MTVGYGDVVPTTIYGKLLGVAASLSGIVFMSLPLPGIIQNFHTGNSSNLFGIYKLAIKAANFSYVSTSNRLASTGYHMLLPMVY